MRSRFYRFTDDARWVLVQAQYEARRLHHELIGPEHVVLAILNDGSGIGDRFAGTLGIDRARFRSDLESLIGAGSPDGAPIGLSDQMYEVLDLTLEEALYCDIGSVRVEHLLVALVRHGGGMAAEVLEAYGITLSRIREVTKPPMASPAPTSARTHPEKLRESATFDDYGVDLTALARAGETSPRWQPE